MNRDTDEHTQSKPNYTAEFDDKSHVWADLTISKKGFRITTRDRRVFMTSVQHIRNMLDGTESEVCLNELIPKRNKE